MCHLQDTLLSKLALCVSAYCVCVPAVLLRGVSARGVLSGPTVMTRAMKRKHAWICETPTLDVLFRHIADDLTKTKLASGKQWSCDQFFLVTCELAEAVPLSGN